jgi:hypothetical protein
MVTAQRLDTSRNTHRRQEPKNKKSPQIAGKQVKPKIRRRGSTQVLNPTPPRKNGGKNRTNQKAQETNTNKRSAPGGQQNRGYYLARGPELAGVFLGLGGAARLRARSRRSLGGGEEEGEAQLHFLRGARLCCWPWRRGGGER